MKRNAAQNEDTKRRTNIARKSDTFPSSEFSYEQHLNQETVISVSLTGSQCRQRMDPIQTVDEIKH